MDRPSYVGVDVVVSSFVDVAASSIANFSRLDGTLGAAADSVGRD